jgi:zinc-binding alcohol dehydrogenase/oxidoreductase
MDIRGTTMGSPREFAQLLDLYERHQLRPVMDRSFHIEQATEAHQFMEKGRNFGKVTLVIGH